MKVGTVQYETREVLAGAYVTERALLTHTVKIMPNLPAEIPICSRVKADSIADRDSNREGIEVAPTCPVCLRRDPRFH